MSRIIVDTKGIDVILARMPGKTQELLDAGAQAVQGRAATLAPVDTGALANSIHTENVGELARWVVDGVEYGIYQELGTSRMSAQPFMGPACEWARPQWAKRWRELFEAL
ncbi:MAG: hypothetical protein HONDAALG_00992 [Gammaproteobacteria bacterium]|nr:hypothetical protein [Gammaproteobacteria bacterium]